MARLIKNRQLAADSWKLLEADDALPADGNVIVPLKLWQAQREALLARAGNVGVWLDGNEEPDAIAADLDLLGVVAVNFPQFADGRGYSVARTLRERYGYKGELRAIGDVLRDQLFYLSRVGFDAFALRDDQDIDDALKAFDDFSDAYQTSVTQPQPLFRRRIAGA